MDLFGFFSDPDAFRAPVTIGLMVIAFLQWRLGDIKRESAANREKNAKLEAEIKDLREKELAAVKDKVGCLEANCLAHTANTMLATQAEALKALKEWMTSTSLKLDGIANDTAAVKAELKAKETWMQNLTGDLARHKDNLALHGGKNGG